MINRITVTQESNTGRNERFLDNLTGESMTRSKFVQEINSGKYEGYYVRRINGVPTPCSKPDKNQQNNLD